MKRRMARTLLLWTVLAAGPGLARPRFLHDFPVENRSGLAASARQSLAVEVMPTFEALLPDELVRRVGRPAEADGHLAIRADAELEATDAPQPSHSRPSFVVDFEQPVFRRVVREARQAAGGKPTPVHLRRFTHRYIRQKSLSRGFDVASEVARSREGDCTEHAVLLAALARAFGYPARVIVGLVLIWEDGEVGAFGHAWTEVAIGGRWRRHDAALEGIQQPLLYLPTGQLDEGPGFVRSLADASFLGLAPLALVTRIERPTQVPASPPPAR